MATIRELLQQSRSMADIQKCSYRFSGTLLDVPKPSEAVSDQSKPYEINLNFSCEFLLFQWVFHNGTVFRYDVVLPEFAHSAPFSLNKLSDLAQPANELRLKNMISEWLNVSEDDAEWMSIDVIQTAVLQIASSPDPGHRVFNIPFKLSLVHIHDLRPRTFEDGERLFQMMMEQTEDPQMVPATDESIKNLKRKRVDDDCEEGDCVICLEHFSEGHETATLPCSHSFHGDCIEEWLKTSHYCPICRFKMSRRS